MAGYAREVLQPTGTNLTYVVVREVRACMCVRRGGLTCCGVCEAGHIVPGDQPERGWDMIHRFVEGKGVQLGTSHSL